MVSLNLDKTRHDVSKQLQSTKQKVNILTIRMGAGHYATLQALQAIIKQKQLPWEIQVTDIDKILDEASEKNKFLDPVKLLFDVPAYKFWNYCLQKGWTWLQPPLIWFFKLAIKLFRKTSIKIFKDYWWEQKPDLVVSLVPLYNKAVWETLQTVKPGTPFATVMTDFADCPPNFWAEPSINSPIVCGTDKAVEQAVQSGVKPEKIFQTSGMVIHPRFYHPITRDGEGLPLQNGTIQPFVEKKRLGLNPNLMTGLVFFGGQGSMVMLDILKRLEHLQDRLQLIFICGHNNKLLELLREKLEGSKIIAYATGFTKDIPYYMSLSDFFIGKPGPGCLSEALTMNLPVIVERNFATLVPERYNTQWIEEKQVGLAIPSFRQIDKAVLELIEPANYLRYRSNAIAIDNKAVFEVVQILQQLLQTNPQKALKASSIINQVTGKE